VTERKARSPSALIQRIVVRYGLVGADIVVANKIKSASNFEALPEAGPKVRVCVVDSRIEAVERSSDSTRERSKQCSHGYLHALSSDSFCVQLVNTLYTGW
jgi:hypothetical protein